MSQQASTILLKVSSILWVVWGIVHILAGTLTITGDTAIAVKGIADGVAPSLLDVHYPDAAGAIINQHGFNLFWIGLTTLIGAVFIWKKSATAIFVTALVGGMTDLGYLIFLDFGGYVKFIPGTLMTIICFTAIALSFYAYFKRRSA